MTGYRLPDYLAHMRQAAEDALVYVDGYAKEDFLGDKRTQQAVVMNLMIIGESTARILEFHPEFAALHPGLPWRGMRGMRNRIAHGYFEINLDVVWDTVRSALPELLEALPPVIAAANLPT
jgi:uncharacterized protein with HEPN domain